MRLREKLKLTKTPKPIEPKPIEPKPIEHKPPVFNPNPGDTPAPRTASQKITAEELREFRELIRHKYALDIWVWEEGRRVKYYSRPEVEEKMIQADAALVSLQWRVKAWDKREYFSSESEYSMFSEIKKRILEGGKRVWMEHPPWEEYDLSANGHL